MAEKMKDFSNSSMEELIRHYIDKLPLAEYMTDVPGFIATAEMFVNNKVRQKTMDLEKQLVGFQILCKELANLKKDVDTEIDTDTRLMTFIKIIDNFQTKTFETLDNIKEPQSLISFAAGDVAGFDLCGWKNPDGSINLNKEKIGEFPKEIYFNGEVYTLEEVKEFTTNDKGQVYCNALYV